MPVMLLPNDEGIPASDVGIYKFLLRVAKTGCISRHPGSGRPTKIMREVKALVAINPVNSVI